MSNVFLYKDHYNLSYTDYGDQAGYPVLVHHGLVGSIEQPDLQQTLEGTHVRMILTARPGYGKSSFYPLAHYAEWADIIKTFTNALGLTQFDVLGMSAGAPYCYALAALLPEQVKRVFIYSGLPAVYEPAVIARYPHASEAEKEYAFYHNAQLEEIAQSLYDMYLAPLPETVLATKDFQDSMANQCKGMAQEAKLQSLEWGFTLQDVTQPVFMQHSKQDEEAPFAAALKTAELLKQCTLYQLDDAPHVSEETLQAFLEIMIKHIHQQR
ncbi:MAG: alpha/beta hydrolase [Chloroflexales bacterium]|nr:alpha/beta hydrolase [Chloroflexales bacterium]